MDVVLDFNDILFGNLSEYKELVVNLLESLRIISPTTFWSIDSDDKKGLSTILTMKIIDLILDSLDTISNEFYSNNLVTTEFPFFLETKEMIECLLEDPIYESDEYLNLAITLFSDFFTLIEVKLLLFDGCVVELEAPYEVLDEYDKERDSYMERFDGYKDEFIELHIPSDI